MNRVTQCIENVGLAKPMINKFKDDEQNISNTVHIFKHINKM